MTMTRSEVWPAARQALEGASMASRTMVTLRRLHIPNEQLSREVAEAQPAELHSLEFLICLKNVRRGPAPGPSGMTSDHLCRVLESEGDSDLLNQVGGLLAVGHVPGVIVEATVLGRLEG